MGLPTGIQSSLTCFANMIVQVNINSFGDAAVAGCGSYTKIEGFAFLIITCIAMSLSTFVGQNLGAHKFDRVKKAILGGTSFCCVIVQAIGLVFYIFAPRLLSIFGASAEAIDYGVRYMRTLCPFYFVIAFCQCIASTLRGSGKTIAPMITLLVCWGAVRVAYITIAIRYVNRLETVSWSYPITWILSSAILLIYFLKSDWMHYFDQLDTKAKNA